MLLVFLAPLMYWYITIPEIIYIIYAMLRSVAYDGVPEVYGIGLAIYYCAFIADQKSTMVVTAVLIVIDFILHHRKNISASQYYMSSSESTCDSLDREDPYYDCTNCGSGNTDGNHCYDCGEDS